MTDGDAVHTNRSRVCACVCQCLCDPKAAHIKCNLIELIMLS